MSTGTGTRTRIVRALLAPLLAFLLVQVVIVSAASFRSLSPWRGSTYVRWDSFHYLSIATRGYYLELEDGAVVGGNTAWFPGYPLVIRAFMSRRLTPAKVGKLVSEAFALALLGVLWRILSSREAVAAPWPSLLVAAFFPGFIYDHAVFPISMVSVLLLLALVLCADGRLLAAGGVGALAAFTYSTGLLVAFALFLGAMLRPGLSRSGRVRALIEGPLLCVVGAAAAWASQWPTVGAGAFFRMQREYYGNALGNPISTFLWNTAHVWRGELGLASLPHVQTVLVALLVAGSCAIWARTRKSTTLLDTLLLVNALVYWLVPQIVGMGVSIYRAEALLIGLVPLLARLPARAIWALAALLVPLGMGMSVLFFDGVLV